DNDLADGHAFEPLEIFRQMPGDCVVSANHSVERHRSDGFKLVHWYERRGISNPIGDSLFLYRNRRFDRGMWIVSRQFKVLVAEIMNVPHGGIELHPGQGAGLALELQLCLFEMVAVKMQVAKGVDEGPGFKRADLGDHQGQKRVGSNVERDA